jgi:hypothetical protein
MMGLLAHHGINTGNIMSSGKYPKSFQLTSIPKQFRLDLYLNLDLHEAGLPLFFC